MSVPTKTVKDNVARFDEDVRRTGSYAYTAEKLSAKYANRRISESISSSYDFKGKRVLDLGCGDGTYSVEFIAHGAQLVLGIDPASMAVESANKRSHEMDIADKVSFEVGNIYDLGPLLGDRQFDVVVLRGVLHHLPDPKKAIDCVSSIAPTLVILEPNGYNPVLKLLERFSRYHIEHEERSFSGATLKGWATSAGMTVRKVEYTNLVPMFCPDWMARLCKGLEGIVERLPLVREIGCGQCTIVATRG
ncbi:methyltransferase domain protein 11 [Achromobacter xylosoxidans A8]|uniref:Methyltransferase domain protein 11 n=1 Tax=Achromobacter xylosoxidans (strain A8) TaxID=762376 RepID=E3HQG8_ACHXA|nr:class I SAM-dependent methyltransferase [Achromobacter xylosoxidans]ADP19602.1 methyltransferase domain protein 11 [Achromobacter xylosoxidans A8]